jgi:hypothetical protein
VLLWPVDRRGACRHDEELANSGRTFLSLSATRSSSITAAVKKKPLSLPDAKLHRSPMPPVSSYGVVQFSISVRRPNLLPLSIAVFCGEHADSFADLFLHPVSLVNDLLLSHPSSSIIICCRASPAKKPVRLVTVVVSPSEHTSST